MFCCKGIIFMPVPGGPGSGRFCIEIDEPLIPPGPTTPGRGGRGACRPPPAPGIGGVGAGLWTGDGLFLKKNN